MLIKSLQVSQFRCWSYRQLHFDSEITYLVGPNSSGKTTLLEAVNYLSTGRSFRTRRDGRLIKWENSYYSIRGEFEEGSVRSIAVSYENSPSRAFKKVKVDDELLSRLSDLQGLFPVVLFSPEQINILTGSPENRRQFLNQLISQYSGEYLENLKEYKDALHQRNSLLKKNTPDQTLLETYEKKMAQTAVYIYQQREKLLEELQDWLVDHLRELAGDVLDNINVKYKPGVDKIEQMEKGLKKERSRALKRGYTTIGIQRDDWQIQKGEDHSLRNTGARGELRVTLIALKYAAAEVIKNRSKFRPVLLFDDLLSELDKNRQRRVIDYSLKSNYQVIFTGTREPEKFNLPRPECVVKVKE